MRSHLRPDVLRVDFGLDEDPGSVLLLYLPFAQSCQRHTRGHEQLVLLQSLGRRDGALQQNLEET